MAEKRPPLPLLLTAQDLRDGGVVYWGAAGWDPAIAHALVARDEAAAAVLDEVRLDPAIAATVIDVFFIAVREGPDGPVPVHYRETSRIIGPSFRDDFGRNPVAAAQLHHV